MMDGWEIHVVDEREDIDSDDSKKKEEEIVERMLERQEVEAIFKKYTSDLTRIIGKFIEDKGITDLRTFRSDSKLKTEIVSKIVRELRREKITRAQVADFVDKLEDNKDFRNLVSNINDKNKAEEAKQKAKELVLEQKEKMTVVKTDEDVSVSEEEAEKDRKREEKIVEAEAENNEAIDPNSVEVIQSIFETMNAAKILVEATTEQQKAKQKLYMNFYANNQKSGMA
jgi:hypothetical protein